jgi:hypothetical protein
MASSCAPATLAVLTGVNFRAEVDATIRRMQLRHAHRSLARGVLLWFLLTLGSAIAAPWLTQTPQQQWVCSAGGVMRMVLPAGDGSLPAQAQGVECPLCASTIAPPPATRVASLSELAVAVPLGLGSQGFDATRLNPPTARGPPAPTRVL